MKIKLGFNNAFKWYHKEHVYSIGYIIKDNTIIQGEDLLQFLEQIQDVEELEQVLKTIEGYFSFVMYIQNKWIIVSDIIRSFPVFYQNDGNETMITDKIENFENRIIDEDKVKEFLVLGYVIGQETLYTGIKQIENAQIVTLTETGRIDAYRYYNYQYQIKDEEDEKLIKKLDALYDKAIKNLILFLNGRRAVIPLSGGQDSRLIAYYLTKNGYKNIIAYTYGKKDNPEAIVSKKVAEFLNIDWYFVEYKNSSMRKKFYDKKMYSDMADYCARGFSVTHIQEWEAIIQLKEKGIVHEGDVVIPGFSGDFIAGSHLNVEMIQKKEYTYKDFKEYIFKKHYKIYPWRKRDKEHKLELKLWSDAKKSLDIQKKDNDTMNEEEFNSLFERFDFQERQVKFISNSVRTYDLLGLQWYMPFWDKELMTYWLSIPLEKRCKRKLYDKFVDETYGDLMRYAPIAVVKQPKNYTNKLCKKIQGIKKLYTYYFTHFLNYYGYIKFKDFLKYCFQYETGSYYFMFSYQYINYIRKRELKNEKS